MKNIQISIFCSIIITTTAYCSQESRKPPFNILQNRVRPGMSVRLPIGPAKPDTLTENKTNDSKSSVLEQIDAAYKIFQIGQQIYSWLPSQESQQTIDRKKKELEEYSDAIAQQREIDTARRAFYQCCKNNQGLNVDRLPIGLPTTCQNVAMDFAALGYREDVEEAIAFFNKFRE